MNWIGIKFESVWLYKIKQKEKVNMRKNTLFHHKKYLNETLYRPSNQSQSKDLLLQNPENSAKFSLLEISEEPQKTHNRTFNYFQNQHSRSYSTQFFNHKRLVNQNSFQIAEDPISHKRNRLAKDESQQSVTIKSTFSNEMRKTHSPSSNHKFHNISISQQKDEPQIMTTGNDSIRKLKKINYLPFTFEISKQVESIDQIFRTAPSKQILAILNKTKLTRDIRQNDLDSKEKSQEFFTARKKSIFNIRHLMVKQMSGDKSNASINEFYSKKLERKDYVQPKELHSTNRNVIKMRLRNRYNKSSSLKR